MKDIKFAFYNVLLVIAFLASCKKEKPALIQPCELSKPVKASFEMGYKILVDSCDYTSNNNYYVLEDSDTTYGGMITFNSTIECYDSLRWIIGSDPTVYTQKEFSLFFDATWTGQTIPITLIVKQEPNKKCNPNDDGIDTLTRLLYFKQYDQINSHFGDFQGFNIDNTHDVFNISIQFPSQTGSGYTFQNLPKGSSVPYGFGSLNVDLAYKSLYFCHDFENGSFGINNIIGVAKYTSDYSSIVIDYSYSINPTLPNKGSNSISKQFIGVRV